MLCSPFLHSLLSMLLLPRLLGVDVLNVVGKTILFSIVGTYILIELHTGGANHCLQGLDPGTVMIAQKIETIEKIETALKIVIEHAREKPALRTGPTQERETIVMITAPVIAVIIETAPMIIEAAPRINVITEATPRDAVVKETAPATNYAIGLTTIVIASIPSAKDLLRCNAPLLLCRTFLSCALYSTPTIQSIPLPRRALRSTSSFPTQYFLPSQIQCSLPCQTGSRLHPTPCVPCQPQRILFFTRLI